ncbi:MAG TPA: hypothetical protein PLH57_09935, partial [Oligoflexia bacterium]|nr:hypothetical protein [Oligoflexia bacterium]
LESEVSLRSEEPEATSVVGRARSPAPKKTRKTEEAKANLKLGNENKGSNASERPRWIAKRSSAANRAGCPI